MSDEPGCCLVLNTEDKRVRLRRHLQVKLPNQPIDRRRSVRLVSINLAGQPFARTVLLAHRQHWLNVARREWSKQQRARLKRHHRHHRSNESGKVIFPFLSNPKVTPDEPPCPSVANPA